MSTMQPKRTMIDSGVLAFAGILVVTLVIAGATLRSAGGEPAAQQTHSATLGARQVDPLKFTPTEFNYIQTTKSQHFDEPFVLLYQDAPGSDTDWDAVSRHIKALHEAGFRTSSVSDFAASKARQRRLPQRSYLLVIQSNSEHLRERLDATLADIDGLAVMAPDVNGFGAKLDGVLEPREVRQLGYTKRWDVATYIGTPDQDVASVRETLRRDGLPLSDLIVFGEHVFVDDAAVRFAGVGDALVVAATESEDVHNGEDELPTNERGRVHPARVITSDTSIAEIFAAARATQPTQRIGSSLDSGLAVWRAETGDKIILPFDAETDMWKPPAGLEGTQQLSFPGSGDSDSLVLSATLHPGSSPQGEVGLAVSPWTHGEVRVMSSRQRVAVRVANSHDPTKPVQLWSKEIRPGRKPKISLQWSPRTVAITVDGEVVFTRNDISEAPGSWGLVFKDLPQGAEAVGVQHLTVSTPTEAQVPKGD